ncbi:MAG: YihA family ribosome biogenesis GTP-binding protein [Bacteroidales bacterium]|nr:YihA family ribosome biogenesis GTP-binding protein [Bacteroidales bacterium]
MIVKNATFVISNSDYRKCPPPQKPEYAFVGRSNVGKSSLINMLTGNGKLAKTSVQPGKTQLINHFEINGEWYLVDLPGYGYARISRAQREKWTKMMKGYLLNRSNLMCVFVLVDSRIPPQEIDIEFINFLGENGIPLMIVFTKTDKQKHGETMQNIAKFKRRMLQDWEELPEMLLSSSVTGYGRDTILDTIEKMNKNYWNDDQKTDL